MPKFKVGDKIEKDIPGDTWTGRVVSVTSGNKGVRAVTIKGDGSEGPTWAFDESEIRLANSRACNGKFKVGDKVTDGSGVYLITGIDNDFGSYEWKLISGRADSSYSEGGNFNWADSKMKIANSRACNSRNPIVAKAMNACARNAAYPKAYDVTMGNVTCAVIPSSNLVSIEVGDYRSPDYVGIDGTPAEVKAKVRGKLKGKDLQDANSVVAWAERKMAEYAKAERSHGRKVGNDCGTARNAGDINAELGRDVDRLGSRLKDELKKQAESYAYWIEADCGREINYLLKVADDNKDVQPSIVAELKRLRRRVDDAIAASKKLPR